jgi:hypothetical protein
LEQSNLLRSLNSKKNKGLKSAKMITQLNEKKV